MPNNEINGNQKAAAESVAIQLPVAYQVKRNVLLQSNVNDLSAFEKRDKKCTTALRNCWKEFNWLTTILNLIPVLRWLPKYSIRNYFIGDLMSGITVAVMHLPQGMAYGLLAGVSPSVGLYMAFFPTLVYFVFGSSRHISVGTLSIISVMTLKLVTTYAAHPQESAAADNGTDLTMPSSTGEPSYTPQQVVTAAAFVCGIQQFIMFSFQLGTLSSLLSEPLVSGFTTGAAMHVLSSQLKDLFGIKIPRRVGYLQIIYTVIDWGRNVVNTNPNTLIVSLIVVTFMILMNEVIKPHVGKLCRFPLPAELMAVLGGTLASYLLDLDANYKVNLVGTIPVGLPLPEFPPLRLMWMVAVDCIAISIVSYSVTISMAMIIAKKQNYEVRPNQEMLALGLSNLVGGLFACLPNATSLSRSLIQEITGGKTQIASVISSFLILLIILWIGPIFEVLPRCVLSGIIIVALKGMYLQALDVPRFFREGLWEGMTWIVTFTAVVLVDVDIGLVFGIVMSLASVYLKGWKSTYELLGSVPGASDLYVDIATHHRARPLDNIHIFRYCGCINFTTRGTFRTNLYKAINVDSAERASTSKAEIQKLVQRTLILDLSCVTHMDVAGMKTVQEVERTMEQLNTTTILAAANERVYETILHAQSIGIGEFSVMPSVHDAVTMVMAGESK